MGTLPFTFGEKLRGNALNNCRSGLDRLTVQSRQVSCMEGNITINVSAREPFGETP